MDRNDQQHLCNQCSEPLSPYEAEKGEICDACAEDEDE